MNCKLLSSASSAATGAQPFCFVVLGKTQGLIDFREGQKPNECQALVTYTVILATREAEIRRISVHSQSGQIVCETLFQKTLHLKKKKKGGW
jgi:hypothetical protein